MIFTCRVIIKGRAYPVASFSAPTIIQNNRNGSYKWEDLIIKGFPNDCTIPKAGKALIVSPQNSRRWEVFYKDAKPISNGIKLILSYAELV